jgi:hypothetical protein
VALLAAAVLIVAVLIVAVLIAAVLAAVAQVTAASLFAATLFAAWRCIQAWQRWCASALVACSLLAGCGAEPVPAAVPSTPMRGPPLEFGFNAPGGEIVDSASTRGRATVLVFVTTYDVASQLATRLLGDVIRSFKPRANALAVVFEDPQYEALLSAYRDTLQLPFPLAMADAATRSGNSAFGSVNVIPTFVVLDRQGRQTWRRDGQATRRELEDALRSASSSAAR